VVHQLFPGQARHSIKQVDIGAVLGHQTQGGAGGLELAVLVIDQQGLLIGQSRGNPGVWSATGKKFMNFRQTHRC
jgi:hypothetical protein